MQRRRRQRRQPQRRMLLARSESTASVAAAESSPSEQDDSNISQGDREQDCSSKSVKRMRYSVPTLPEDIMYHIHSLLPLRDAARDACVSRVFLNSWRCRPNLCLSMEALGFKQSSYGNDKASRDFTEIVDHILKKHSGFGLKTFRLTMYGCQNVNACHLDSWLHPVLTLGIEDLILHFPSLIQYNFPLSFLSGKSGNSIRYLHLSFCAFRPTVRLGCFKSLKKLHLHYVRITGDELGCLLPDSVALEQLELEYCRDIICLKIPRVLLRLNFLKVFSCNNLQEMMSEAPNLSSLCFEWFDHYVPISLGEAALHVKKLEMLRFESFYYAQLPTIVPNLEVLAIESLCQIISTPCAPSKFWQLKYLNIRVPGETRGPSYDYLSLCSFLSASPCLETFILRIHVPATRVEQGLFTGDPSYLRRMPEHRHEKLKRVQIAGFYPAKSLLELACYVLETATSLELLELGTTYCSSWFESNHPNCYLVAIRTYIKAKVPSTVRLDVQGPCTRTGGRGFRIF